jgi:hypothetical protein
MEQVELAKAGEEHAARLVDAARRHRSPHPPGEASATASGQAGSCPVCGQRATVTDWPPRLDWLGTKGCSCAG